MTAGLASILAAANGHLTNAAQLIMLAMLLDGLDGNLARRFNRVTEFGAELDSYVDMIAFGIAPAVLIYRSFPTGHEIVNFLLALITAGLGVVRLSRFKASDPFRGQKGYVGLPITISAAWIALFTLLCAYDHTKFFSIQNYWVLAFFIAALFACLILQISNIPYPKPTKHAVPFSLCTILILLVLAPPPHTTMTATIILLILGCLYVFLGPLVVIFSKPSSLS